MKVNTAGAATASAVSMQTADAASTGATFTDSASGGWTMKYENEVALIPLDDLLVPMVLKKPAVILTHSERGRFRLFRKTTTHADFSANWLIDANQGFARTLGDIWARKDQGTFPADGNSWMEVVRIRQKDVAVAGDLRIVDGKLAFDGNVNLGPAQASINGFIGRDGVEITASMFVATAQVSIREDHIALSSNTGLTSMSASIANDGLNVHTDMLGLASGGVSIGSGNVEVSANFGGSHGLAAGLGTGGVHISVGGAEIIGARVSSIATGGITSIGRAIGIRCC